ncbi:hypothetical protein Baya_11984 [Bagarius yarrelli]|uniref:Uncharacterized protein n=1 Tax=Bagarius yarrelli TaxID=175774 RepID=A0A556V1Y0_BAGYA|nr:hypothetical protein Baya_11984 [Bagarius yarrelli]
MKTSDLQMAIDPLTANCRERREYCFQAAFPHGSLDITEAHSLMGYDIQQGLWEKAVAGAADPNTDNIPHFCRVQLCIITLECQDSPVSKHPESETIIREIIIPKLKALKTEGNLISALGTFDYLEVENRDYRGVTLLRLTKNQNTKTRISLNASARPSLVTRTTDLPFRKESQLDFSAVPPSFSSALFLRCVSLLLNSASIVLEERRCVQQMS